MRRAARAKRVPGASLCLREGVRYLRRVREDEDLQNPQQLHQQLQKLKVGLSHGNQMLINGRIILIQLIELM